MLRIQHDYLLRELSSKSDDWSYFDLWRKSANLDKIQYKFLQRGRGLIGRRSVDSKLVEEVCGCSPVRKLCVFLTLA